MPGDFEAFPFGEVAGQVVGSRQFWLSEQGIIFDIAPNLPIIQGNRRQLEQNAAHLTDNAVKFMSIRPEPQVSKGFFGIGWLLFSSVLRIMAPDD